MNAVPGDAAVWARTLEGVQREFALHRETVNKARDLIRELPADELLARQADDVLFAVDDAVGTAPFLFGRATTVSRIAPDAVESLEAAVGLLEKTGVTARQPSATLGGIGASLDDAARLLGTTDALIGARLSDLARLVR